MAFKQFVRKDHLRGIAGKFYVSFRPGYMRFSSEFSRQVIKTSRQVTVYLDTYRLALNFSDISADSLSLTPLHEGKSWKVSTRGLEKDAAWIKEISRFSPSECRFEPKWDDAEKKWILDIAPPFEQKASAISDIPSTAKGIYRYKRDDDIVYIGRGRIRTRANDPSRENWEFETVEFSLIEDEQHQKRWESYYLDKFVSTHSRLPLYNRISGQKL